MGKTIAGSANVSYANVSWAKQFETDISLDFGLMGSILVARSLASQTSVPIPQFVSYPKYVLQGIARSADLTQSSQVTLATNHPSLGNFYMLRPPQPLSPARNATGVGAHPVFSWTPVASADSYVVKVVEQGNSQPKWQAVVDGSTTAIAYPNFSDGDINGGALIPGAQYTWEVHAVSASFEGTSPSALDPSAVLPASILPATGPVYPLPGDRLHALGIQAGPIFAPYEKRTLESETAGMEFTR
ncbi:MAG: hypothetical protein KGR26_05020, partial [Cyanobacteria bacterium REEB65]|nr:hypothetical protein [Cyanobacteria bacterium REEB65]